MIYTYGYNCYQKYFTTSDTVLLGITPLLELATRVAFATRYISATKKNLLPRILFYLDYPLNSATVDATRDHTDIGVT